MSAGGPSKYCPRCDTALPLRAPYCETCGYQFYVSPGSAPQATQYGSSYGPPQYAGQRDSGSWSQAQPGSAPQGWSGYPPQSQPGYPYQGQPDYDYPYDPGAVLPPRSNAGKIIAVVLMLVVLVGSGAAAWYFYLRPGPSSSPPIDRHGVPDSVPLPDNLTFDIDTSASQTNPTTNQSLTADEWGWKVADSDPATIAQFYRGQMPGKGWTSIRSQTTENGHQIVYGCQAMQVLLIEVGSDAVQLNDSQGNPGPKVTAPAGGSALGIFLLTTNSAQVEQRLCANPL